MSPVATMWLVASRGNVMSRLKLLILKACKCKSPYMTGGCRRYMVTAVKKSYINQLADLSVKHWE